MKIPTKPEPNGRILYTVLSRDERERTCYVRYVGTDATEAKRRTTETPGAVMLADRIAYDAREAGEE
jgi:hypothetical protein